MTTVISEVRSELGDDWEVNGVVAKEFPIPGENFYNSMSPNIKNIKKLVADSTEVAVIARQLSDEEKNYFSY